MTKITGYALLTAPATGDVLPIVDVSDTTMASSGTTKQVTVAALLALGGGGGGGGGITLAGDLGNSSSVPWVVATHLASPLPFSQGGTNATSASAALTALGAASSSALTTETTRAEAAEAVNAAAVTTEATARGTAITAAVATETSRATTAEALLATTAALTTETTRATTAEGLRPATGSQAWLFAALPALVYTAITRNTSEAATSATVTWPDGTTGTYTADTLSSAFPGAVDAYHISYSGHTVTQAQVTRDSAGAVTVQPALTYA